MPSASRSNSQPVTAFKDHVGRPSVLRLADALESAWPAFPRRRFADRATRGLASLELKARIARVADALAATLPPNFLEAALVVEAGVGPSDLGMWEAWPVMDWIVLAGRGEPDRALDLIAALTCHASGEFAVRPFIDDDPVRVARHLRQWIRSPDEHVRRLASEGTRPRLPWAPRVAVVESDPVWALPVLEKLVADPSPYVRLSVANHLNDINKVAPDQAKAAARRWLVDHLSPTTQSLVRHGLRTLVKAGDQEALELIGAHPSAAVDVVDFVIHTPVVQLGERLELSCALVNEGDEPVVVVVDYALGFLSERGTNGNKVFKLGTFSLDPGERRHVRKRHTIKAVTIRTYRSGPQTVALQVNGRRPPHASGTFDLLV